MIDTSSETSFIAPSSSSCSSSRSNNSIMLATKYGRTLCVLTFLSYTDDSLEKTFCGRSGGAEGLGPNR